ncbi:hypothetical protein N1851_010742 [Merluccius polli]|uniref:DUF5641 domain-containing protein n=1 Tax=Merluccius polli TaxID=89951 RepID=A0AA47MZ87_MERPO|nr:hypothetical protein N1851_010742 [Merluccius polli]
MEVGIFEQPSEQAKVAYKKAKPQRDVVLLKDKQARRHEWSMGRITKAFQSDDGLVRKVDVKVQSFAILFRVPSFGIAIIIHGEASLASQTHIRKM